MRRVSLMNVLVAAVAAGVALVGYNALVRGDSTGPNNATDRLRSYLSIDAAKKEAEGTTTQQAQAPQESAPEQPSATPPETPAANEPTNSDQPAESPAAAQDSKTETVYTVKQGDTYGCIAEKYYGSYEHYVDIMASNPVRWEGFSERELHVDAKLVLPAIAKENLKPTSSLCS